MPYLPNLKIHDTAFTPETAAELATHLALIREIYEGKFPEVEWSMIDFRPSVAVAHGDAIAQGESPGMVVDNFYGEALPVDEDVSPPAFIQPHGNPTIHEPDRWKYKAKIVMNAQVVREQPEDDLTLSGKAGKRDMRLILSTHICDILGITVNEGDKVTVRGVNYKVQQAFIPENAYWLQHTNIPLYIHCWCGLEPVGT